MVVGIDSLTGIARRRALLIVPCKFQYISLGTHQNGTHPKKTLLSPWNEKREAGFDRSHDHVFNKRTATFVSNIGLLRLSITCNLSVAGSCGDCVHCAVDQQVEFGSLIMIDRILIIGCSGYSMDRHVQI